MSETFDPLSAPLGLWSLTGMRPRRDMDSAYELVCCGAPVECVHFDNCPQTPIFADMVREVGPTAPWYDWPLMWMEIDITPQIPGVLTSGSGSGFYPLNFINPRWELTGPGSWTLPDYSWPPNPSIDPLANLKAMRERSFRDVLQPLLEDADLTIHYTRPQCDAGNCYCDSPHQCKWHR